MNIWNSISKHNKFKSIEKEESNQWHRLKNQTKTIKEGWKQFKIKFLQILYIALWEITSINTLNWNLAIRKKIDSKCKNLRAKMLNRFKLFAGQGTLSRFVCLEKIKWSKIMFKINSPASSAIILVRFIQFSRNSKLTILTFQKRENE